MDNQKIWLSGSSGMVGQSISARLVNQGHDVHHVTNQTVTNHFKTGNDTNHSPDIREYIAGFEPEQIEETCWKYGVPEIMIHAGWGSITDPESPVHLGENVKNSLKLMTTLYRLGLKKFIFLGSINEYGQRGGRLSEEMEPRGTLRKYELGKRQVGELGIQESNKSGTIYIHVRLANTFGAPQKSNSLIETLHQAYDNKVPAQLSACEDYRDYIHTSEVAEAVLQICSVDFSTTVNLGSGKSTQLREFVEKYWDTLGGEREGLHFGAIPSPWNEPKQLKPFLDISKIEELTNWRPASTIEEGIKQTIKTIRSMDVPQSK